MSKIDQIIKRATAQTGQKKVVTQTNNNQQNNHFKKKKFHHQQKPVTQQPKTNGQQQTQKPVTQQQPGKKKFFDNKKNKNRSGGNNQKPVAVEQKPIAAKVGAKVNSVFITKKGEIHVSNYTERPLTATTKLKKFRVPTDRTVTPVQTVMQKGRTLFQNIGNEIRELFGEAGLDETEVQTMLVCTSKKFQNEHQIAEIEAQRDQKAALLAKAA